MLVEMKNEKEIQITFDRRDITSHFNDNGMLNEFLNLFFKEFFSDDVKNFDKKCSHRFMDDIGRQIKNIVRGYYGEWFMRELDKEVK